MPSLSCRLARTGMERDDLLSRQSSCAAIWIFTASVVFLALINWRQSNFLQSQPRSAHCNYLPRRTGRTRPWHRHDGANLRSVDCRHVRSWRRYCGHDRCRKSDVGVYSRPAPEWRLGFAKPLSGGSRFPPIGASLGGLTRPACLSYVLTGSRTIDYPNLDIAEALNNHIFRVFSERSLWAIGIFLMAAAVVGCTRIGRDLIAFGSDPRASSRQE